jgi:hypothetical protein
VFADAKDPFLEEEPDADLDLLNPIFGSRLFFKSEPKLDRFEIPPKPNAIVAPIKKNRYLYKCLNHITNIY